MEEAQEATGEFLKATEEATVVFDLVNEALNEMALLVEMKINRLLMAHVAAIGDDRLGIQGDNLVAQVRRIIAFVGNDEGTGAEAPTLFQQDRSLSDVALLGGSQGKGQGVTQAVHFDVDFGAEATAAATEGLRRLPPFCCGAPAAQGWARTVVLSNNRCSMSGSSAK